MGYLRNFDDDVFISYAHNDDVSFPQEQSGWVSRFYQDLEQRVRSYVGTNVSFWRNAEIRNNEDFASGVLARLSKTGLFVAIISPSYLRSDWCRRELEVFTQEIGNGSEGSQELQSRIFQVEIISVDRTVLPWILQGRTAYRFYLSDQAAPHLTHELRPGLGGEFTKRYFEQVDELAREVAGQLRRISQLTAPERANVDDRDSAVNVADADASADRELADERKAKIFLAYSRKDMTFVDGLVEALKARGVENLADQTEIYAFEDWWNRIKALIIEADAVIVVLSPDSLMAEAIDREITYAVSLNKRIFPVVVKRVDRNALPEALRGTEPIFLDEPTVFAQSVDALAAQVRADLAWIRQHSRFALAAHQWLESDRSDDRLLNAADLEDARNWIDSRSSGLPQPNDGTLALIDASRQNLAMQSRGLGVVLARTREVFAVPGRWLRRVARLPFGAAGVQIRTEFLELRIGVRTIFSRLLSLAHAARVMVPSWSTGATLAAVALVLAPLAAALVVELDLEHGSRLLVDPTLGGSARAHALETTSIIFYNSGIVEPSGTQSIRGSIFPNFDFLKSAARAQSAIGTAAAVTGNVTVQRNDVKVALKVGDAVFLNDTIRADANSSARIILIDKTTINIASSNSLVMSQYLINASHSVAGSVANPSGLATASYDGTIKFWELTSGKLIRTTSVNLRRAAEFAPRDPVSQTNTAQTRPAKTTPPTASTITIAPLAFAIGAGGRIQAMTELGPAVDDGKGNLEVDLSANRSSPNNQTKSETSFVAPLAPTVADSISAHQTVARNWQTGTSAAAPFAALSIPGTNKAYAVGATDGRVAIETTGTPQSGGVPSACFTMAGNAIPCDEVVTGQMTPPTGSPSHHGGVTALAATNDGKLASVADDGSVILWTLKDGQFAKGIELSKTPQLTATMTLEGHTNRLSGASFSPDGTRLVTASWDDTARLWDPKSGVVIARMSADTGPMYSAAFSPDGARIVTASADGTAHLFDARTGATLATLAGHTNAVLGAAFSPDATRVVTASADNNAGLWDAKTGTLLAMLRGHTDAVISASFSPDGTRVVTASDDKTARLWDVETVVPLFTLQGHTARLNGAAFSPDGTHIATASDDGTARLWDAKTGAILTTLSGHTARVSSAAFSPDGARVVTASDDKTARLWDANSGVGLATLSGHTDRVNSATFSPDGTLIVTASDDKTARLWDAKTGAALAILTGHEDRVVSAAFSRDRTRVVTASFDKTARIWSLEKVGSDTTEAWCMLCSTAAFSADGTRLITGGWAGLAQVWNSNTGDLIHTFRHGAAVNVARLSADGSFAITAGDDGAARVWDVNSSKLFAIIRGHTEAITQAELTPDGTALVTGSRDGSVRVTSLGRAKLLNYVDFVPAYRRYVAPMFAMITTWPPDLKEIWGAHSFLFVLIIAIGSIGIAMATTLVFARAEGALLDTGDWILGAFAEILRSSFKLVTPRSSSGKSRFRNNYFALGLAGTIAALIFSYFVIEAIRMRLAPISVSKIVFPSAVSRKYSNEPLDQARLDTCLDQYNANSATGGNGGLEWIPSAGGGYYSECNKRLSGLPIPLTLTSTPSATTQVGQPYSQPNPSSGGSAPYTYSVSSGALPAGTTLNVSTGTVSGTPTTAGGFSYTIKMTDSGNLAQTVSNAVSGTIELAPLRTAPR